MSNTVCAYCGVGCRFDSIDGKLKGKDGSCAKGISQVKSIHSNRLTQTKMRATIEDTFQNSSYDEALEVIASKLKATNPNKVGFYLSGQMLNEDYYVANKLAKGFVGTAHCDTNSRTCMASAVVGYKKAYGLDYVPVVISDIDNCNLMIIIGGNPAESHVVLFNKIKKAQKKGMRVVVIDPRKTLSAMSADLYLPLKVGSDIDLLNLLSLRLIKEDKIDKDFIKNHVNSYQDYHDNLILNDEKTLLSATGLDKELFEKFYMLFITSKNIITAWTMGINQASQGVDKNLAIHNLHILTGQINKAGSGPFSLTGQPNAMGGREVGGLSTTLAVHLDYTKENCEKVSQFWKSNTLPKENGLTAFEMIEQGELEVLIICHTDPVYHLPNRHLVEDALKKINLVVEINAYEGSQSVNFSHIQIPVTAFGQKEGTQTNLERRVSIVEAFEDKGSLLQDWEVFALLGKKLGFEEAFDFKSSKDVFYEYQQMCKLSKNQHLNLFDTEYDLLKKTPFYWGENLFKDNKFFTQNQKANLFYVQNNNLSEKASIEFPFTLLTGRIRDQWHSGSKTEHIQKLLKHKELKFVEINALDAKELNINDGDMVTIKSKRGSLRAKIIFSEINRMTLFIPVSHKDINYLTPDTLDMLSKEPDYNHSAVRIIKE